MAHFGLLTLSLILCSLRLNQAANNVYYITTTLTDLCTVQPCLTLSQFAAYSNNYLHSNTTLVFLPGIHYFSTVNLTLSNVDNFVMKSENSTAQIRCTGYSHFHFNQSQCIHIVNLEFIGCGVNQVKHVEEFMIQDIKFKGQQSSRTALELIGTTARIVNSTFLTNRKGSFRKCVLFYYTCSDGFFGGAIISTNSAVDISQSKFDSNGADYGGVIFAEQHSIISMSDNVFINNNGKIYGGVLYSHRSIISIEASKFYDNSATYGGVLFFYISTITIGASAFHDNNATYVGILNVYSSTITIELSDFYDNGVTSGGIMCSESSSIIIKATKFHSNRASSGVLYISSSSNITIKESEIFGNSAIYGGSLHSSYSSIKIRTSKFHDNNAKYGGVLHSYSSTITIKESEFHNNSAIMEGGVLYSSPVSTIKIQSSKFHDNSATNEGGVLYSSSSTITIEACKFQHNIATGHGGVLRSSGGTIIIEASEFQHNSGAIGGVLSSSFSTITTGGSNFTENSSPIGAVIYATARSKIQYHNDLLIANNWADRYAVIYLFESQFNGHGSENVTFAGNLGSLVAFNSNISFIGYALFVNNKSPQSTTDDFQEGGAITLFQSNAFFDGACNLEHNNAENGGAIHSIESKIYVTGDVTIARNTATRNGGGVYLLTSELNCQQKSSFVLLKNAAVLRGGGLHAISSTIKAISDFSWPHYIGTRINFTNNTAKRGGGSSLEANAKFYILKYTMIYDYLYEIDDCNTTTFTANSAHYGGAVYVDDNTNSGACARADCFFQVFDLHGEESDSIVIQSIYFSRNYANNSGSTLYGGLLDRCVVSQFAEDDSKYEGDSVTYFKSIISSGESTIVSSDPVEVCFCISNEHNCTHQRHIDVKRGQTFSVSLVAVDQISQPVNATIQTSLSFTESGLAEGQLARKVPAECTDLTFNVVSPHNSENLTLCASDGPCKDADLSKKTIEIHFLPCSCPIGLQILGMTNKTNCTCECHSDISQYVEYCDSHTGSLVKQPQFRAWISYINDTNLTDYLVYPYCPFDYCLQISPPVDLNQPNGADAQCAFSRSSLLCGSCQHGFSLSLGSSRCLPCPSYWPVLFIAITIAAILAGIILVALLLVLNMTVAVGTSNGLIFYANVVYVNKSILLPFQETNFIAVFISWLNLELGIDMCYFPGMDTYIKTWLQLAFPAYIILLVVLVIIISSYSLKFSNLIGKKDPVATLATLVLLSYAKLLEVCFKSLSVGVLTYSDSSSEMLWLPDATVRYLSGKHIPLFIAAIIILLVGLVYTALLFSWQWLLYLPKWRIFSWSRNSKIQTFIETHHTPYTPKHRYWTGLLLIVRIILYLVSAVNVTNNPTVPLTAISFTLYCIIVFSSKVIGGRLYRKSPIDVLEALFYSNILSFSIFTWYSLDNPDSKKEAAAYTSVIITFIVLLLIILYHVYTHTTVFSKVKAMKIGKMIDKLFIGTGPQPKHLWNSQVDDDIHRFNELLDTIDHAANNKDYKVPINQKPVKYTQSVVEVHQPYIEPPDPEEANNTQHAEQSV